MVRTSGRQSNETIADSETVKYGNLNNQGFILSRKEHVIDIVELPF